MFMDRIHGLDFRDYCLAGLVDERRTTPASIMEQFADQLRQQGYPLPKFESELAHYKETLQKYQGQGGDKQETLVRNAAPELVGAVVKDVPVVGGILEKGTGLAVEYILDELDSRRLHKDMKLLEDPIRDLTSAFVSDLNRVTDHLVILHTQPKKYRWQMARFFDAFMQRLPWPHRAQVRKLRVVLFFDTFERLENIFTYRGHSASVHSVAWSLDGTRIASASDDRTVQVWKAK
jgi:prefoldin subunit 5